jgi:hypothetical protein
VTVAGSVRTQRIELDGTGTYRATDLACAEADVRLDGVGTVAVRVHDRLDVEIGGAGDVVYVGEPTVTQRITGIGAVTRIVERDDR